MHRWANKTLYNNQKWAGNSWRRQPVFNHMCVRGCTCVCVIRCVYLCMRAQQVLSGKISTKIRHTQVPLCAYATTNLNTCTCVCVYASSWLKSMRASEKGNCKQKQSRKRRWTLSTTAKKKVGTVLAAGIWGKRTTVSLSDNARAAVLCVTRALEQSGSVRWDG